MDLADGRPRFAFGENWRNFANVIDQRHIDAAILGIKKLFPQGLAGKTFLDIGCGSGLHSLAALMLGAEAVVAIDIDENSVSTTRDLLTTSAKEGTWDVKVMSVFDASPDTFGTTFDIVYSWGVLHHTGDMWLAIERASKLTKQGGEFCLAIYSTTTFDPMWKLEKRFYSKSPHHVQWIIRQLYISAFLIAKGIGQQVNPLTYVRNYSKVRGMSFSHDVHDWLGGYPYETSMADELSDRIKQMGFEEVRSFRWPKTAGIFGTGCHEFVFKAL